MTTGWYCLSWRFHLLADAVVFLFSLNWSHMSTEATIIIFLMSSSYDSTAICSSDAFTGKRILVENMEGVIMWQVAQHWLIMRWLIVTRKNNCSQIGWRGDKCRWWGKWGSWCGRCDMLEGEQGTWCGWQVLLQHPFMFLYFVGVS